MRDREERLIRTRRSSAVFVLVSVIYAMPASGGAIPDSDRTALLQETLSSLFWGQARLRDGSVVQPIDEHDRNTMPISQSTAHQVLDVGEISGYAEWCGLDWQSHYLTMTASARKNGFDQKQMAFIGVVHGLAQGVVFNSLKPNTCGHEERAMALELMRNSPNKQF
jgi:hypothetical protein